MKFDILNRLSGFVIFTADIDCDDDADHSVKLGLAVKVAIKSGAGLYGADLECASIEGANLCGAKIEYANLYGADLRNVNLRSADLYGADLRSANLYGADLECADLRSANLCGAKIEYANLCDADLRNADLRNVNIEVANIEGADLRNANLEGARLLSYGINDYVKNIQIDQYAISYTADVLQIGCQSHAIAEWRDFDDERIFSMDGKDALKFWRKYKNWIFQTIELCPAKPTKEETK